MMLAVSGGSLSATTTPPVCPERGDHVRRELSRSASQRVAHAVFVVNRDRSFHLEKKVKRTERREPRVLRLTAHRRLRRRSSKRSRRARGSRRAPATTPPKELRGRRRARARRRATRGDDRSSATGLSVGRLSLREELFLELGLDAALAAVVDSELVGRVC